jgi:hypothetical protein
LPLTFRELVNSHLRPQIAAEERKYTLDAIATATEQRNLELNEIKQTVMQGLKTVEANEAELQTVSSTMELSVGILELSEALRNQKPELVAESVKSLRTVAEKVNAHAIVDAALDALPQTVYEEPLTPVTDLMRYPTLLLLLLHTHAHTRPHAPREGEVRERERERDRYKEN